MHLLLFFLIFRIEQLALHRRFACPCPLHWDLIATCLSSFLWFEFPLGFLHPLMPSPLGSRHRILTFVVFQPVHLSIGSLELLLICHCSSSSLVPTSSFVGSGTSSHPSIPGYVCGNLECDPSSSKVWAVRPSRWGSVIEPKQVRTKSLSLPAHIKIHPFE